MSGDKKVEEFKGDLLFGGGVLKKQFAGITGPFTRFDASKIAASSKSSPSSDITLEIAGERKHGGAIDNSIKVIYSKKGLGVDVLAKASGTVSADVSLNQNKNYSVRAGVDYKLAGHATTTRSQIDFKNETAQASLAFKYPLGGRLEADLSAVAVKSGVSAGVRAVVSSSFGADPAPAGASKKADAKESVSVDDYEVALGWNGGNVQAAVALTGRRSRLTFGGSYTNKQKVTLSGAVSLDLQNEYKPSAAIGASVDVNDRHTVRALGTIPTGDVALQLASKLHDTLRSTVTAQFNVAKHTGSVGVGLALEH